MNVAIKSLILGLTLLLNWGQANAITATMTVTTSVKDTTEYTTTSNGTTSVLQKAKATLPDGWDVTAIPGQYVFVDVGDIPVPIVTQKPTIILSGKDGSFVFEDGVMTAATNTTVNETVHPGSHLFKKRPTLFVSIQGFQVDGTKEADWQDDFDKELSTRVTDYQYKHFYVRWSNTLGIRKQAQSLINEIRNFLAERKYAWDVVLVGHSRGGVMAHMVEKALVGNSNIDNLHVYLLDPTASTRVSGDEYPTKLLKKSPTNVYGTVLFDGKNMELLPAFYDPLAISDFPIVDYTSILMPGSTHTTIHKDWIGSETNGLKSALAFISDTKDSADFYPDGTSSRQDINISVNKGLNFDGDITRVGDNINVWAEATLEGLPVGSIDVTLGLDGAAVAVAMLGVVTAQAAVVRDRNSIVARVGVNQYLAGASLGADRNGVTATAAVNKIGASVGVGAGNDGVAVSVQIGEVKVGVNAHDTLEIVADVVDTTAHAAISVVHDTASLAYHATEAVAGWVGNAVCFWC